MRYPEKRLNQSETAILRGARERFFETTRLNSEEWGKGAEK
jgi:hypothetical protein